MPKQESWIPLNVKTYREGFLRLQGWICFSCLAFFTAGLLVMYELLIMNVEDQDFRDILFDYRITRPGVSYQHKHFANGQFCCHQDPAVFNYSCAPDMNYTAYMSSTAPACPPTVQFTCPDLMSGNCNTLRAVLYPALGLDTSGAVVNCSRAGQVLLKGRTGSSYTLTVHYNGAQLPQQLTVDTSRSEQMAAARAFVDGVISNYSDPFFTLPREPLGRSVQINGQQVVLQPVTLPGTQDKWGEFGWPWELWPWPPSAPCTNTGQPAVMTLKGKFTPTFSAYESDAKTAQPTFTVAMFDDSLTVPQYQMVVEPDGDNSSIVHIKSLTGIRLVVGLVAPLGVCEAWQLHKPGAAFEYGREVFAGTAQQLTALKQPISAKTQAVAVSVHDVSEPEPLALPRYAGELYVYVALVLGGVWMFATAPLIIMFGVMVINVQRNRGLPIFLYRYMRKYRGW